MHNTYLEFRRASRPKLSACVRNSVPYLWAVPEEINRPIRHAHAHPQYHSIRIRMRIGIATRVATSVDDADGMAPLPLPSPLKRRTTNHEPRATAGSPTPRTPKRAGARSPDPPPARRTDSCRSPTAHLRPDLMGCFPRLGWIIALQSQSFIMNLSGSSVCVSVARGRPPRAHRPLRARPPPYAYVYVINIETYPFSSSRREWSKTILFLSAPAASRPASSSARASFDCDRPSCIAPAQSNNQERQISPKSSHTAVHALNHRLRTNTYFRRHVHACSDNRYN